MLAFSASVGDTIMSQGDITRKLADFMVTHSGRESDPRVHDSQLREFVSTALHGQQLSATSPYRGANQARAPSHLPLATEAAPPTGNGDSTASGMLALADSPDVGIMPQSDISPTPASFLVSEPGPETEPRVSATDESVFGLTPLHPQQVSATLTQPPKCTETPARQLQLPHVDTLRTQPVLPVVGDDKTPGYLEIPCRQLVQAPKYTEVPACSLPLSGGNQPFHPPKDNSTELPAGQLPLPVDTTPLIVGDYGTPEYLDNSTPISFSNQPSGTTDCSTSPTGQSKILGEENDTTSPDYCEGDELKPHGKLQLTHAGPAEKATMMNNATTGEVKQTKKKLKNTTKRAPKPKKKTANKKSKSNRDQPVGGGRKCPTPECHSWFREGPYRKEVNGNYSSILGFRCLGLQCQREVVGVSQPGTEEGGRKILPSTDSPVWVCSSSCQEVLWCNTCFKEKAAAFNLVNPGKIKRVRKSIAPSP
jgi:hypothetical protein